MIDHRKLVALTTENTPYTEFITSTDGYQVTDTVTRYTKSVYLIGGPTPPTPDPLEVASGQGANWVGSNVYEVGQTVEARTASYTGGVEPVTYRYRFQFKPTGESSFVNGPWTNTTNAKNPATYLLTETGEIKFQSQAMDSSDPVVVVNSSTGVKNVVAAPVDPAFTYGITSPGGVFNLRSTGTVDYAVDWDSSGGYESSTSNTLAHTYTAGDYDLVVYSDDVYRPYLSNSGDADQITSVVINAGANLGTNLDQAWRGSSNMTSFVCPFDVTSGVTSFGSSWRECSSLVSFPLIDTSSGTSFRDAWHRCSSLVSFPLIDTSSAIRCDGAWASCTALTSFPLLDTSSLTKANVAWASCTSLANFPANMFDTTGTLVSYAFDFAWWRCALTAQSIENILVSLDTNGQSNISLSIHQGTNAAKTTWSAAANTAYGNLIGKGWSISYN